ncbi:uncharacterized protein LOC128242117 [Mya arenaria]|uniref:uncharacterized protein LOC128242117 n=1 Tax=Mya arenaria TaxID=6604 RepID=UPI0022E127B7|nr:uncharacterized protein LOC128242117 [Mya arenaria]
MREDCNFRGDHWASVAGTIVLTVTLGLYIVGFFSGSWAYGVLVSSEVSVEVNLGLWTVCGCEVRTDGLNICTCTSIEEGHLGITLEVWHNAVRIFAAVSLSLLVFAMVTTFIFICWKPRPKMRVMTIVLVIAAGSLSLASIIVFPVKLLEDKSPINWTLGYSYVLVVFATGACLLMLAPLFIIGHVRTLVVKDKQEQ